MPCWECLDAFWGWFNEEFPLVLADVLSQEVETLFDVRYLGLFLGQF